MDTLASAAAAPPSSKAAPPTNSTTKHELTAAEAAWTAAAGASATRGPVIPTEYKSEAWPYPLNLPTFPLDFNLLRNPKLSIFHDGCGLPLVRYYWPASNATAEGPSKQSEAASTRARGVVVLIHDEGTHTVFDWLKNAPLMCKSREETKRVAEESVSLFSPKATGTVPEGLAAPPPLDIGQSCAEFTGEVKTEAAAAAEEIASASATADETPRTMRTAAAEEAEAALKGENGDAAAAAAAAEAAAGAAAAALTAAATATEGIASLLPAPPLFRDLPQTHLHAARTACYEGSWVELFNAAGFDVHAMDLLQHGLSGLVERQQQRQRKRRSKQETKSRQAAASGTDSTKEGKHEDAALPFDLLAEDICGLLEEICRYSTLPIFLLGQGIGATAAARAAELLAKKGKLGKPHSLHSAAEAAAKSAAAPPAAEEMHVVDPATTQAYEGAAATSPLLAGVRHIGKETILPVQHITVQARPIPLAGLVLLSPVLQLREFVTVEQMATSTGAAARKEKAKPWKQTVTQKTEGPEAQGRRWSGESYMSELENSTSAEEAEGGEKGSGIRRGEQKGSSWNILSWLLGRGEEKGPPRPVEYGVRLRRRRHPLAAPQHVLLPPLDTEEERELAEEAEFDALYEKLYYRDRLTIKTLLPCKQLAELRKGVCRTLSDARWLLIPIERDSQQLVTVDTWKEQYQKWKQTIAKRVKEGILAAAPAADQLRQQQGVPPFFLGDDPLAGLEPALDLAPWLKPEARAAAAAGTATGAAAAAARRQVARSPAAVKAAPQSQHEDEDDVQQEEDATDAEVLRRKQLKRMQMAFYLKVLVVQGMTSPQETQYVSCGCCVSTTALPADREVECFAEATDMQGVVTFYRSLGGKGSVARRILVQHKQLPPPVLRKSKRRGRWVPDCCAEDEDAAAAAALAAAASAEAAQTDSLVLLDVGSEEARMGGESEGEEEDEVADTAEDKSYEGLWPVGGEAGAAGELDGTYGREVDARLVAFAAPGVATDTEQGLLSPYALLPAAAPTAAAPLKREGAAKVGDATETRRDSDLSSNAAIEARYAALQEERKRLDENLRLLDAGVDFSTTEAPAGGAAAEEEGLPPMLRRPSSVYKSVYERDLLRYGTTVRLPDRPLPLGGSTITSEQFCRNLLLKCFGTTYGRKGGYGAATEASLERGKPEEEGPRLESLIWVKEYPVSWWNCTGGLLLPYATCVQGPCEANIRVRVMEEIDAPVRVVEKIIMHEATDALKATIAEIEARERRQKGGTATAEAESEDREELVKLPVAAPPEDTSTSKRLPFGDFRTWRRVAGIVVDSKGMQVPLNYVEALRVHHPREYVNLFLYGATSETAAALAGEAAAEGMQRRQVTLWLLPEVHHAALCQADKGNKLGKQILDKWLLPALEDLQRSEALWQGSQMRSQLRKQLSSQSVLQTGSP